MYYVLPRTLPQGLEGLTELALDLRWTWSHAGDALWRRLSAELWEQTRNPWAILQNMAEAELTAIARDPSFVHELSRIVEERQRYLNDRTWYAERHPDSRLNAIAYFSMEFGLSEAFPLYAGGLGILAGDYLKTASDLGVPIIGVGLLYQEGYFRQMLDETGRQQETYPYNNPTDLPIQPVADERGAWLTIGLPLPGRILNVRVWQANVGRTRLYLLDSNHLLNGPRDRGITGKLYGDGPETRLTQEIVLGLGGWAMLERLGLTVDVCHLNEGHCAFAVLERARCFMRKANVSFPEACWATRAGNVFTTHTPVAAGFDSFDARLVEKYFGDYVNDADISMRDLLALGRMDPHNDDEPFNMAYLALRGSAHVNGVSELHGRVSRHLFRMLYPHWPEREIPVSHVTNGVHVPSWDSSWADKLWTTACGKRRWLGSPQSLTDAIRAIDDETLWRVAGKERGDLVRYARERLEWQLEHRGVERVKVADASQVLDPNILTLGFARRFTGYKRPNLLLHHADRFARLLCNTRFPVQIVVSGKAHPGDDEGKQFIKRWLDFVTREDVRSHAVFLEDYDMALAQQMVQGVDVWINTPRSTWEACGTSGMKVLVNGGLNVSTLDGWWAEAFSNDAGWAINAPHHDDRDQDGADALELYRLLEEEIVPMFYERDARGVPTRWLKRIRTSMSTLAPLFSSNRMLQDYLDGTYLTAAVAAARRSEQGGRLAKELHEWHGRLAKHWHEIHFGPVNVELRGEDWHFDVAVYLGHTAPECVKVQLYADADSSNTALHRTMTCTAPIAGAVNGYLYHGTASASRPSSHYTARVIGNHPEASVPADSSFVCWQR